MLRGVVDSTGNPWSPLGLQPGAGAMAHKSNPYKKARVRVKPYGQLHMAPFWGEHPFATYVDVQGLTHSHTGRLFFLWGTPVLYGFKGKPKGHRCHFWGFFSFFETNPYAWPVSLLESYIVTVLGGSYLEGSRSLIGMAR